MNFNDQWFEFYVVKISRIHVVSCDFNMILAE